MPASSSSPLRRLGGGLLTTAAVALAAAVLVPALLGYQRYVITSGSMTGTYDRGSLVYDRVVPTAALKVGDVITYAPPAGAGPARLVTHRIVSGAPQQDGARVFRPKGDANPAKDPWTFTLRNRTQARVAFHLPYAGFALAALAERRLRMLIIGIPALHVALSVLARLWQETGQTAV